MEKAKKFLPLFVAWLVLAIQFFVLQVMVTIPEPFLGPYWPVCLGTFLILYKTPVENAHLWKKGILFTVGLSAISLFGVLMSGVMDHVPSLHELEQSPSAFSIVIAACPYGTMFCT